MGEEMQRGFHLLSSKQHFIGLESPFAILKDAGYSSVSHLLIVKGCVPSNYNLPFSKVDYDTLMTDGMPWSGDDEHILAFSQRHVCTRPPWGSFAKSLPPRAEGVSS